MKLNPKAQNTRYGHVTLDTPYWVYLTQSNAPGLVRLYLSPDAGENWIRFQHVLSRSFSQQVIFPVNVSNVIQGATAKAVLKDIQSVHAEKWLMSESLAYFRLNNGKIELHIGTAYKELETEVDK